MTIVVNDVSDVGIYNIVGDQGTTFRRTITYKDSLGAAIALGTGASAKMRVRKVTPVTSQNASANSPSRYILSPSVIDLTSIVSAVTVSSATPGVVTLASHPFIEAEPVYFTATAMPTGLTANVIYYVKYVNVSTFQLSATAGGAAIATSSTGTAVVIYRGPIVSATIGLELTVASGVVEIVVPASVMSAAPAAIYDYDLEVTLGTAPGTGLVGEVIKLVRGLFEVRFETTA